MTIRKQDGGQERRQTDQEHAVAAVAARAEVVQILTTAVFSLLIDGHRRAAHAEQANKQSDCS